MHLGDLGTYRQDCTSSCTCAGTAFADAAQQQRSCKHECPDAFLKKGMVETGICLGDASIACKLGEQSKYMMCLLAGT